MILYPSTKSSLSCSLKVVVAVVVVAPSLSYQTERSFHETVGDDVGIGTHAFSVLVQTRHHRWKIKVDGASVAAHPKPTRSVRFYHVETCQGEKKKKKDIGDALSYETAWKPYQFAGDENGQMCDLEIVQHTPVLSWWWLGTRLTHNLAQPKKDSTCKKSTNSFGTAFFQGNGFETERERETFLAAKTIRNSTMSSDTESTAPTDESGGSESVRPPKTVEEMYQKKTPREHILLRPDTYGECTRA
eukprot:scaffold1600_cov179-Amphora_coffeaeformis.AAC.8